MLAHFLVDFWFYVVLTPALQAGNALLLPFVALGLVLVAWWAWRAVAWDRAAYPPAPRADTRRWLLAASAALALFAAALALAGLVQREDRAPAQNPEPTQRAEVDLQEDSERISGIDGMTMIYIPAGDFEIGAARGDTDERPAHMVYLDAFWIDQREVSNAMYARCVQAGACTLPRQKGSRTRTQYYGNPAYGDNPVVYVTWEQAGAYCAWAGRRLPTEAQWEKAARGVDGRRFPWGDAQPQTALLNWNGETGDTVAVGRYPDGASPYGALDMLGNVLEWVSDCYDSSYYRHSPRRNPAGPAVCGHGHRVIRGGVSWAGAPHAYVDLTNRLNNLESAAGDEVGFRCAFVP